MRAVRYTIVLLCGSMCVAGIAAPVLHAQNSGCADIVRAVYKRMLGDAASNGEVTRYRYTITTTSRSRGAEHTAVANVEMIASSRRIYVGSEQAEIAQDGSAAVTVLPARKLIYISSSNAELFRRTRGSMFSALRDSVIATSDVTECATITDRSSPSDRKVTFRLRPVPRQRLKMESVTIYLNTARETLQRLVFTPTSDNSVSAVEIRYNAVEYNYATDRLSRPLLSQFLDGNGHPLPKYKGYTVTDARKPHR